MTLHRKKTFQANEVIHDQFIILGKLDNKKHSSVILKGFDKIARDFVVIKITSSTYREKNKNVTKILQKLGGSIGVPKIIWRGMEGPNTYTVMECLGPNLKKLFLLMDKQFSVSTIAMIGYQILTTLQDIHAHDYVCCNIMPKEILIGLQKKSLTLFITDYKQARKAKNTKLSLGEQVSQSLNKSILNKFSSVNLHLGLPASKKDDLESLGYILVYFFKRGNLFDKNMKFSNRDEKIKFYEQQKLGIVPDTFCKGLPTEMVLYMTYIKSMQTSPGDGRIDYTYMKKLFKDLQNKNSSSDGFQYDWISKATTYDMASKGRKNDIQSTPSNSIMCFPSSKACDSEVNTEERQSKELPLSSFAFPGQRNILEYDFFDVDESPVRSVKSDSVVAHQIQLFDDKIQTIQTVKKRNSSCSLPSRGANTESPMVSHSSDHTKFMRTYSDKVEKTSAQTFSNGPSVRLSKFSVENWKDEVEEDIPAEL